MQAFIHSLPKAELHLHIEGTLEPELKFLLAERNDVDLPYGSAEEMRSAYDFDDLPSFLAVYYEGMKVLLEEQDFYELAWAYFSKAASQNVVYAEVFFDPQAHTSRGVAFETVLDGLHRARIDAWETFGLRAEFIMCFLRDMSADSAMETLDAAVAHADRIIGVGLDSDEKGNPPLKFAEVFARARDLGFRITMHCDVDQQDSVRNIWQCLDDIAVERIDHGVNCLEDPRLVAEIRRRGLGLTVCPISNGYVAGTLKADKVKEMLELGLLVSIHSDDPAYFPGYIEDNLVAVADAVGLRRAEVVTLIGNAFEASWIGETEKNAYLAAVKSAAAG